MRRIAFVALASFAALVLLFTGAAWAPSISLTVRNQSSSDVQIQIFQDRPNSFQRYRLLSTLHHEIIPKGSFHASGIERESCVLVRVANDIGDPKVSCRDNHTPLDVRCDVSSHYSCNVHRGEARDVVVKIVQPGAKATTF